jgi:two-component system catabolic regulation response regulator CreB
MDKPTILLIDDDPVFLSATGAILEQEHLQVITAQTGKEALAAIKRHKDISLALVDIGLPDMSGFEVLHWLRTTTKIPVVFLTARDSVVDEVLGLELGALGYLNKSTPGRAVAAHVKALLRGLESKAAAAATKSQEDDDEEAEFEIKDKPHPDLLIDDKAKAIYYKGINLNLSSKQFIILAAMVRHPRQVFSLGDFLDITDPEATATEQSPRNLIKKIRQSLRKVAPDEKFIRNHHNDGYSLI